MLKFRCGGCSQKIGLPESAQGKRIKCPGCGKVLRVPTLQAEEAAPAPAAARPPRAVAASSRAPAPAMAMAVVATPASPLGALEGLESGQESGPVKLSTTDYRQVQDARRPPRPAPAPTPGPQVAQAAGSLAAGAADLALTGASTLASLVAIAIAVVLSVVVWVGIAMATGYELGLVAWAIGGAVGMAAALPARKPGPSTTALALLGTVVAIIAAKYGLAIVYTHALHEEATLAGTAPPNPTWENYNHVLFNVMLDMYDLIWVTLALVTAYRVSMFARGATE